MQIIAVLAVSFFVLSLVSARLERRKPRAKPWRETRTRPYAYNSTNTHREFYRLIEDRPKPDVFDRAEQLRLVENADFRSRKLLNRAEARLFAVLETVCAEESLDWRVMAQVSLGEILASPSISAYRAINSKRVDLLLVSSDGDPLYAIEYQGSGHHLGTAATRDAIKKEALRKAGIGYVEVVPGDTPADIRNLVRKLAGRPRSAEPKVIEAEIAPHVGPAQSTGATAQTPSPIDPRATASL